MAQEPLENLLGYWKLDDGNGTMAVDSSGNWNNGTLSGNPLWTTGILGNSLNFSGETYQTVSMANESQFDFSSGQAITLAAWINPTNLLPNNFELILAKGQDNGGRNYYFDVIANSCQRRNDSGGKPPV